MVKAKDRRGVDVTFKTSDSSYQYVKVKIVFARGAALGALTPNMIKVTIQAAMKSLFGLVGKATPLDVLTVDDTKAEFIIRAPADSYRRMCQALVLHPRYDGVECAFHIVQSTKHLIALSSSSRDLVIPAQN